MQTQIRCCRMRHLIRVSTVCKWFSHPSLGISKSHSRNYLKLKLDSNWLPIYCVGESIQSTMGRLWREYMHFHRRQLTGENSKEAAHRRKLTGGSSQEETRRRQLTGGLTGGNSFCLPFEQKLTLKGIDLLHWLKWTLFRGRLMCWVDDSHEIFRKI